MPCIPVSLSRRAARARRMLTAESRLGRMDDPSDLPKALGERGVLVVFPKA